jgi:hypothetical protein
MSQNVEIDALACFRPNPSTDSGRLRIERDELHEHAEPLRAELASSTSRIEAAAASVDVDTVAAALPRHSVLSFIVTRADERLLALAAQIKEAEMVEWTRDAYWAAKRNGAAQLRERNRELRIGVLRELDMQLASTAETRGVPAREFLARVRQPGSGAFSIVTERDARTADRIEKLLAERDAIMAEWDISDLQIKRGYL